MLFRSLAVAIGLALLPAAVLAQANAPVIAPQTETAQPRHVEHSDTKAQRTTHKVKRSASKTKRKAHHAKARRSTQRAKAKGSPKAA